MNFLAYFFYIVCGYFAYTRCQPVIDDTDPASDSDGIFPVESQEDASGPYKTREFTQFDLNLLNTLSSKHHDENVVVSPASMKSLLALLTKVYAIEKLKSMKRIKKQDFYSIKYLMELKTLLQNNETTITIDSRNKIYRAADVNISEAEADSSEIETLDFTSATAADTINKWVNESTRGLIPSVVDKSEITELTKLVLLNCIYLKAKWDVPFNPSRTTDGCFHSPSGECRRVKFMHTKRQLKYAHFQERKTVMFEIPFADQRYVIVFVVPHGNVTIYDVLAGFQNVDLFKSFDKMNPEEVNLMLPRTTIEFTDGDLVHILKKNSMRSFFGSNAKLDALLQKEVLPQVNTVFHRAKIILNEEGAEAAAVSGGLEFRSVFLEHTVKVDRPFLFFLRDVQTGLILFEGLVNSPDEAH